MRDYTLIRSDRKSLALQIKQGRLVVRAPRGLKKEYIDDLILRREDWIAEHMERQRLRELRHPEPDEEQQRRLKELALRVLPEKTAFYGEKMGLKPACVKISGAKSRFGSCSSKGNISFSWRLMAFPEEAVDYVVVHELAHLRHMDHGREFYALVESILPDWKQRREMLR